MKQITTVFILFLLCISGFAQKPAVAINEYAAIDKKMLLIPDSLTYTSEGIANYVNASFKTSKEKTRAVFIWTASSIRYDIDNMFAINFYESREDRISKALKNRKGICSNYAAIFNDVCLKAGIQSFIVEGYTKQSGFTDYIPHAWCAAFVDTAWFMFDPTWGSGYVYNGKFFSKINNAYFMARPSVLIKSHMPFDYLWQFLYYPVTNQEFYEGKVQQNKSKPYFNFPDSIRAYQQQDSLQQWAAVAARIEKNGVKNSMIFDRLYHVKAQLENANQHNKAEAENERQQKMTSAYNSSIADYNEAINDLNVFIDYRNKQFVPEKTDAQIQAMIDTPSGKLNRSKEKLNAIINPGANLPIAQQLKIIDNLQVHIKEQQDWLTLYLSKPKSKRKAMFYEKKTSLFGIPLN